MISCSAPKLHFPVCSACLKLLRGAAYGISTWSWTEQLFQNFFLLCTELDSCVLSLVVGPQTGLASTPVGSLAWRVQRFGIESLEGTCHQLLFDHLFLGIHSHLDP